MKNLMIHKMCAAVYSGTDNIVISVFCGIRTVALYGNYLLIHKGVSQIFFHKLLDPIQATIGNIIYDDREKEKLWKQFKALDVFSFYFASYIGLGFFIFYQPTIELWMGRDYLLPFSFVIVFSITIYWEAVWLIVYKYRSLFGNYHQDRNCMILSAIANLCVSLLLASRFAVAGIQTGTLVSYFPIAYGRIRFVVKDFFGQSMGSYFLKHAGLFLVVFAEGIAVYYSCVYIPVNIMGFLIRGLIWFLVPMAVNTLVFINNPDLKELLKYFRSLKHSI